MVTTAPPPGVSTEKRAMCQTFEEIFFKKLFHQVFPLNINQFIKTVYIWDILHVCIYSSYIHSYLFKFSNFWQKINKHFFVIVLIEEINSTDQIGLSKFRRLMQLFCQQAKFTWYLVQKGIFKAPLDPLTSFCSHQWSWPCSHYWANDNKSETWKRSGALIKCTQTWEQSLSELFFYKLLTALKITLLPSYCLYEPLT